MRTSLGGRRLRLLAVAALVALALLGAWLRPLPATTISADSPAAALLWHGFFAPEQSDTGIAFRWSSVQSQLWLLPPTPRPLLVRLRLNGDRPPPDLTLHLPDGTHTPLAPMAGWRTYTLLVPAAPTARLPVPLTLRISPYCPAEQDNRVLGVPLAQVEVTAPAAGRAWGGLLPALLMLGALVGLAWLTRRVGVVLALAVALTLALWLLPLLAGGLLWATVLAVPLLGAGLVCWRSRAAIAQLAQSPRLQQRGMAVGLLLPPLLLLLPLAPELRGTLAWAIVLMPGTLLGLWLVRAVPDASVRWLVALATGLGLPVVMLLALHRLAPDLLRGALWASCLLLSAALAVRHATAAPPRSGMSAPLPPALMLILALAVGVRLLWLGNAEFQGDEARAMLLAMAVQHGQPDVLLLHRKGPVEALLPAAPLILTGQITEWAARLPFALAGIGVVLAGYVLATYLWHTLIGATQARHVGLLVALILALDGFLIGFARIVQYQSIVLLMSAVAVLGAWLFATAPFSDHRLPPRRALSLCAGALALGLLAHYDGVYVVPVLLLLVLRAGWQQGWRSVRAWLRGLAVPVLLGAGLLASFYVPFVLHEQFSRTAGYLTGRLAQDGGSGAQAGILTNHLPGYLARATFYNTTFQVAAVGLALIAGVAVWLGQYLRPRWLALGMLAAWLIGIGGGLWGQLAPLVAGGLILVPLAALLVARATPYALRVVLLWFTVPFWLHSFVISDPRTHFYTIAPPTALLAAYAGVRLWHALPRSGAWQWLTRLPLAGAGVAVVCLAVPYLWLLFLQQSPEYQREFPAHRPSLYRAQYGDQLPGGGNFGFPRRDGWPAIGLAYQQGTLTGTYATNQRDRIAGWYTRGAFTCDLPDTYIVATVAGAQLPAALRRTYAPVGCVLVDNKRLLSLYQPEPARPLPAPLQHGAARAAFAALPVPNFPLHDALAAPAPMHPTDAPHAQWQAGVWLRGYDVGHWRAGGQLDLALYWEPIRALPASVRLDLRLLDPQGRELAEFAPACTDLPPATWQPAQLTRTQHAARLPVPLAPDAGGYVVQVRLWDQARAVWLPLAAGDPALRLPLDGE